MEYPPKFTLRTAAMADLPLLQALIERSGIELSVGFYTDAQAASVTREVFGVDLQLLADGSYYAIEADGVIVACGGWGRRASRFGAGQGRTEPDRLLDPACEPARIRAFFVAPGMARRGLGSMLLAHCAAQAKCAGFGTIELTSTLPGEPLYLARGFQVEERFELALGDGVRVPVTRMRRAL
jgi:GNAT superfamily N-acetyltransferase